MAAAPPRIGTGRLLKQDEEYRVVAQVSAVQELPMPVGSPVDLDDAGGTVRRFRTAKEQELPHDATSWHFMNDESRFCPEYLRRYLHPEVPVSPPDTSRFVFPKDPVKVRFWAEHTEQLAAVYGYGLHVHIRRVDPYPKGEGPPAADTTALSAAIAELGGAPRFAVDERVAELLAVTNAARAAAGQQPCSVPDSGTTKVIPAQLTCGGQFELRIVAVKETDEGKESPPERVVHTTTFSTSRYQDPHDMLWELGIQDDAIAPVTSQEGHRGWQTFTRYPVAPRELIVARVAPGPSLRQGDHDFDEAITALRIEPWPICTSPGYWTLWVPGPSAGDQWQLHGILLEAPEPIVRQPRVALAGAQVGGVALGSTVVDSSGCRILFLGEPFAPTGRFTVQVTESVGGEAKAVATVTSWTASAPVVAQPAVVEEIRVS